MPQKQLPGGSGTKEVRSCVGASGTMDHNLCAGYRLLWRTSFCIFLKLGSVHVLFASKP